MTRLARALAAVTALASVAGLVTTSPSVATPEGVGQEAIATPRRQ